MGKIVIKFEGLSVSSLEKMKEIAEIVMEMKEHGHHVVIVTSEAASTRLVTAITETGGSAVSLERWHSGIATDACYLGAQIENVNTEQIERHVHRGEIVVITGPQGVEQHEDIMPLRKEGSEMTAVAVAVAIEAERVEIYTDVDGIYTADPVIVPNARQVTELTYDEMLELPGLGAAILHPHEVELAKKYNIPMVVQSLTSEAVGTFLKGETKMEKNMIVSGVSYEADIIRLTVGYDSYEGARLADLFTTLADNGINVDIIVQAVIEGVKPTISFSLAKEEFAEALRVLESSKLALGFDFAKFEVGLAKVSIIGSGMVSNPGVAARMFARLSQEKIQVKMVSTSEIKVSVVVPQEDMVRAANALHHEFQLHS